MIQCNRRVQTRESYGIKSSKCHMDIMPCPLSKVTLMISSALLSSMHITFHPSSRHCAQLYDGIQLIIQLSPIP